MGSGDRGWYATARRRYEPERFPVPLYRLGRLIVVGEPWSGGAVDARQVVLYARMSSADQKPDLDRQVARVTTWARGQRFAVWRVLTEVDSALYRPPKMFLGLLHDPTVSTIVVERRNRFTRFGAEYVKAALAARGRQLLVGDVTEVLTSPCGRFYRQRAAAAAPVRRAIAAVTRADRSV